MVDFQFSSRVAADPGLEQSTASPATPLVAMIRTRMFELAMLLWSLGFGVAIISWLNWCRTPRRVRVVLRSWSTGFIRAADVLVGVRYRIENLPAPGSRPAIYVANHQSYWESIALTSFIPDVNVVSKREAMQIPVFGWGLMHAPMIAVDRNLKGSNLRRIVRLARASLAEGRSILIFPEGTRVEPGGRRRYERGLELLYAVCGVPVVPIVHNAGQCWTKGFNVKRPGLIVMRFLEPIPPGRDPGKTLGELEQLINEEKDKLLQ